MKLIQMQFGSFRLLYSDSVRFCPVALIIRAGRILSKRKIKRFSRFYVNASSNKLLSSVFIGIEIDIAGIVYVAEFTIGGFAADVGSPGVGLAGDGFADDGLAGDGFTGDGFTGDGLAGDGFTGEGLAGDGLTGDGLAGDGFTGDGFTGDGFTGDGLADDGLADGGLAGDGLAGDELGFEDAWLDGAEVDDARFDGCNVVGADVVGLVEIGLVEGDANSVVGCELDGDAVSICSGGKKKGKEGKDGKKGKFGKGVVDDMSGIEVTLVVPKNSPFTATEQFHLKVVKCVKQQGEINSIHERRYQRSAMQ
ncbi:CLUMA_CG011172, isoform A [Clunio marinus]|uniref:CLUMA_CG011172, isoform A n=1 Tax=Clunio marinus TaxID=568069 RepID=A0A1J1IH81_9DIPT|nr:CLUMA_CG011172, isoform A [Clunio marinus]